MSTTTTCTGYVFYDILSSDSNTVWIILNICFTLRTWTPTVCDSLLFTGPASAGAWKSGVGRFLCQVRNLYFFSVNQTVSENLFFKFTKKICLWQILILNMHVFIYHSYHSLLWDFCTNLEDYIHVHVLVDYNHRHV